MWDAVEIERLEERERMLAEEEEFELYLAFLVKLFEEDFGSGDRDGGSAGEVRGAGDG